MNATDERMLILRMIEDGKISAEEGAKLLTSLGQEPIKKPNAMVAQKQTGAAQWFKVQSLQFSNRKNESPGQFTHRPDGLGSAGWRPVCSRNGGTRSQ